jgi:TRAP transporter TAXI family solute receptor
LVCASLFFAALASGIIAAEDARFFRIGTAATAGSFFEIGGVIASAISSPPGSPPCGHGGSCGVRGLLAVAQTTQGSLENLRLINNGQLDSGFAQADLAGWAYTGTNIFTDAGAMPKLRAIASLFPESLHLVVRADSSIRSIGDLAGKTVALGEPGSGTVTSARVLLAGMNFGEGSLVRAYLPPSDAVDALKAGTIDAFFLVGVVPIPAISELAMTTPIRLVPIEPETVERLAKEFGFYRTTIISGETYPGVADDTPSIGFSALWVTNADIDADLIYAITTSLWNEASTKLLTALPIGHRMRLDYALTGLSVPLHPGAERYYREAGFRVDTTPRINEERVDDREKGATTPTRQ